MKKNTVFSLVHEQSVFMTAILALLSFLSIMALGIALSIGTGVMRWNNQWESFATVQVTDLKKSDDIKKIIDKNSDKIDTINEITTEQMQDLMAPWISSGGDILKNYLPKMWEIKFKSIQDMHSVGEQISPNARFLTHSDALSPSTSSGWKMIAISSFVLLMILGTIGMCISYIARNTALLHRRELEILNQVGASDTFVAKQMQIIVGKISLIAATIGFFIAAPVLLIVISVAHSARVGLLATLGLSGAGWLLLLLLPVLIVFFAIYITRRTTFNILKAN
jgi:cell division protein FtsX